VDQTSSLLRLLRTARRRVLTQLLLEQGSYALTAALAALVLLLLLGTQVLDWYWPLMLALVMLGAGLYRIRRRVPDTYEVAQQLDSRMGLHDALSTAVYFGQPHEERPLTPSSLIEAQRQFAEQTAQATDPVAATPLSMPRQAWAAAGLIAICGTLLMVRYGFHGSLSLRQPLVDLPFNSLFGTPVEVAKAKLPPKQKLPEEFEGITVPPEGKEPGEDRQAAPEGEQFKIQTASDEAGAKSGEKGQSADEGEPQGQQAGEEAQKGEGKGSGEERTQSDQAGKGSSQQNAKAPSQNDPNQQNSQQSGENSSLMDKMRDAMANMLARMKMSPQGGESSKKSMSNQQGAPQSAGAQKQAGQKGAQAPGKDSKEGQSPSDQQGEQQGEGQSKMNAQGKTSDGAGEKQQAEGKSGAGKQDGEKDIRAAEQAAAMGKISELLGKRAKDMTGEVMVEVSSGKQRLKTDYVQRNTTHGDSGGEIHRDEVPVEYQQFVQEYFEQVRKAPQPTAPHAPAVPMKK
jgi:hypothetical protein